MIERIERIPLHAVLDSLTKAQNPVYNRYLKCDLNALQVWDPDEKNLLAQVIYLPDKHLSYVCHILIMVRLNIEFPRFFGDKMDSTIQFLQASASASRHATTALRYHFARTKDASIVSREDAIRSFPYSIYPIEMGEELLSQLSKNPNFVLQGFEGMQPQIQQAVNDLGLNLEDYGRKGKGSGSRGSKGRGKGKRSDYPQKNGNANRMMTKKKKRTKTTIKLEVERVPHGATVALLEIGHDPLAALAMQAKAPRTRDGRTTPDQLETANGNP